MGMGAPEESQLQSPSSELGSRVDVGRPRRVVLREIIETLLLTLFIFWIVNSTTGRYRVEGHSMEPTLHEGEYLIINKLSYYLDEPRRGDIVVLHYPRNPEKEYIKRIIGLPGDRVEVGATEVRVNGTVLEEPYINGPVNGRTGEWVVPEDHFFLLGDNRANSSDSRDWSFLPREELVGKAMVIYWGIEDLGPAPHYSHPLVLVFGLPGF